MAQAIMLCPPLRGWHPPCPLSKGPHGEGRGQGPGNPSFSPGDETVPTILASMGSLVPEDMGTRGGGRRQPGPAPFPGHTFPHSTLSVAGLGWCWSQPCPQPVMGISSVCPDAALTPSPNKGGACRAWNRQRMCRDMGSGRGTGADGSRRGCRCFCLAWARSSHRCPCSWGVGSCQLPVDHSWVLCP